MDEDEDDVEELVLVDELLDELLDVEEEDDDDEDDEELVEVELDEELVEDDVEELVEVNVSVASPKAKLGIFVGLDDQAASITAQRFPAPVCATPNIATLSETGMARMPPAAILKPALAQSVATVGSVPRVSCPQT